MTNKKRERKIFVSTHTIKSRSSKTFLNMENVKKVWWWWQTLSFLFFVWRKIQCFVHLLFFAFYPITYTFAVFLSINQQWTFGMEKLSGRLGYSYFSFHHVLILFSFCKIQNGSHPKMYVVCTSNTKVVVFVFRKAVVLWTLAPHLHGTAAPEEKAKAEKKTVWSSQGVTQGFYILKVHSNGFCENTFVLSLY